MKFSCSIRYDNNTYGMCITHHFRGYSIHHCNTSLGIINLETNHTVDYKGRTTNFVCQFCMIQTFPYSMLAYPSSCSRIGISFPRLSSLKLCVLSGSPSKMQSQLRLHQLLVNISSGEYSISGNEAFCNCVFKNWKL